jgi:hypothetical protein
MRQVPDKLRLRTPGLLSATIVAVLGMTATACTSAKPLTQAATTTTAASTTSGAPTPTYPLPPPTPISIPRASGSGTPDGSGCDPASSQTLTDGIWFGVLKSVDASNNTIGLDLACYFTYTSSQGTTGGTSVTTTPPPNDYSIRNVSPNVYTLKVAPQVAVLSLAQSGTGGDGEFNPTTTGVASANAILTDQSHKYVWVQITHGYVVVIQGQFTP